MTPTTALGSSDGLTSWQVALQLAGLAGTSYWLSIAIQAAPGFEASQLATLAGAPPISGPIDLAAAFFQRALLPGIFEEILFRGILFAVLSTLMGPLAAVVASALFFGAVHGDLHHAAVATVLGLQLGLVRALFGLPLAIAAHTTNNTLALAASLLAGATQSPSTFQDAGGPAALAPALLVAVALSGSACASLVQNTRSRLAEKNDPECQGPGSSLQTRSRPDD